MNSPNPLFYRCKFLPYQKQDTFLDFYEKPQVKMKRLLRSAAGCPRNRFTLCVCFCVFPSLNLNENPIRSETSVREKLQNCMKNILKPLQQSSTNPPKLSPTNLQQSSKIPSKKIQNPKNLAKNPG